MLQLFCWKKELQRQRSLSFIALSQSSPRSFVVVSLLCGPVMPPAGLFLNFVLRSPPGVMLLLPRCELRKSDTLSVKLSVAIAPRHGEHTFAMIALNIFLDLEVAAFSAMKRAASPCLGTSFPVSRPAATI